MSCDKLEGIFKEAELLLQEAQMNDKNDSWILRICSTNPNSEINEYSIKLLAELLRTLGHKTIVEKSSTNFSEYFLRQINIIGPDGKYYRELNLSISTTILDLIKRIALKCQNDATNSLTNINWEKETRVTTKTESGNIKELAFHKNLFELGIEDGDELKIQHLIIPRPQLANIAIELSRWANSAGISTKKILQLLDIEHDSSVPCDWLDLINMVHAGRSKSAGYGRTAVSIAIMHLCNILNGNTLLRSLANQVAEE